MGSADTAMWHAHDEGSERQKQQLRKGWIDPSEEPALIGELEKIVRVRLLASRALPASPRSRARAATEPKGRAGWVSMRALGSVCVCVCVCVCVWW